MFLRYAAAKLHQLQEDTAYRIYLTDCLRNIGENMAVVSRHSGGEGRFIQIRFADILHPKPEETRTGEEIIAHLRKKLAVN